MKLGDHPVLLVPDRTAFGLGHSGQRRIPQHPPLDIIHDVERRADHRLVLAQDMGLRHRKAGRVESLDHAVFSIYRVRGRQQLAGGLSPQDVFAVDLVGRVRLAAFELLDRGDPEAQEFLQGGGVDPVTFLDGLRADELLEHAFEA
jgi:hypothetical protein